MRSTLNTNVITGSGMCKVCTGTRGKGVVTGSPTLVYFVPFGALFGEFLLGLYLGTSGDTWYTSFLLGLYLGSSFWGFIWGPRGILGILRSFWGFIWGVPFGALFGDLRGYLVYFVPFGALFGEFLLGLYLGTSGDTWYTSFLLGLYLGSSFWGFIWGPPQILRILRSFWGLNQVSPGDP